MRPRVVFGSPNMYMSTRIERGESWWHVPIVIKPAPFCKKVEGAYIKLVGLHGDSDRAISMRWFSRDSDKGDSERTLMPNRVYLIPIIYRKEGAGDGSAFITNENWMLKIDPVEKWPIPPGAYDFWLEIISGSDKWRSGHTYRANVPPKDASNGHFTLNIHYGNIY